MSAGARKGERRGGRGKGTPNRLSSTRVERTVSEGRKLPPDELLRNAENCRGMAGFYSPKRLNPDTGEVEPNPQHNPEDYGYWLAMERDALKAAAPYYAPRLMAVAVKTMQDTEEDHDHDDPRRVFYDIYAQMRERGQIRLKELAPPVLSPEIKTNGSNPATIEAKAEEECDDGDGVAT